MYDNVRKGILSESARQLGGIRETKPIDFMTAHRSAYRALEKDDEMLGKIRAIEESINARGGFYYLPKGEIESKKDAIPHMAMIAFTTSVEGLDTSHTAFAYKSEGRLTFIHASSARKKVVIDETTLSDYCERQKSCTGIMVMPVLESFQRMIVTVFGFLLLLFTHKPPVCPLERGVDKDDQQRGDQQLQVHAQSRK